jgi:hypothetical protein
MNEATNGTRWVEPHIAAKAPGLKVSAATIVDSWCKKKWVFFRRLPGKVKPRYRILVDHEGWPVFTEDGLAGAAS